MFGYFWKSHEESDCTIVIAVVHLPKLSIIVQKRPGVGELQALKAPKTLTPTRGVYDLLHAAVLKTSCDVTSRGK